MFKKLSAIAIAAAMMLSLAACGENTSAGGGNAAAAVTGNVSDTGSSVSVSDESGSELSVYERYPDAHVLVMDGEGATLDGVALEEYDYVWNVDPSTAHDEVKNCPAEYHTGTEPDTDAAAYIAHDIIYYPELDESGFTKVNYDGEQEWVYYYTAEGYEDYIFSTLPVFSGSGELPTEMMHSAEEAYENPVIHITQPGTYILEGSWQGQIWVDLGDTDETFTDENAKVTLVLSGAEVECTVAPSLVVYSAYEADNGWAERTEYSSSVDISDAGVKIVIADETENSFTGANIYRILKTKLKSEDDNSAIPVQKKAWKIDGAFYSYVSMVIDGEYSGIGVLNIRSTTYGGLDTELHLAINGGNVNIYSADDGINCNEDYVSVVMFNGGSTHIYAGLGAEGDGVDSNGYIVVNGGTVIASANPASDNGLDSESGTEINGGTVVTLGSNMGDSSYTVYVDGEMQYGSSIGGGFGGGVNFRGENGFGNFGGESGDATERGGFPGFGGNGPRGGFGQGQTGAESGEMPELPGQTGSTDPADRPELPGSGNTY